MSNGYIWKLSATKKGVQRKIKLDILLICKGKGFSIPRIIPQTSFFSQIQEEKGRFMLLQQKPAPRI